MSLNAYIDVGVQKFISLSSEGLGFMDKLLEDNGLGNRLYSLSDNSSCESTLCENKFDNIHDEPCLSPDDSSWNGAVKYGFLRIIRGDPGGELIGLAGSDLLFRRLANIDGDGPTTRISWGPEERPWYVLRPDTIWCAIATIDLPHSEAPLLKPSSIPNDFGGSVIFSPKLAAATASIKWVQQLVYYLFYCKSKNGQKPMY